MSCGPELDIVVSRVKGASVAESSQRAQAIFDACAERNLHLALVQLPERWFSSPVEAEESREMVTCLRSVLMKPEHEAWLPRIWSELDAATAEVLQD